VASTKYPRRQNGQTETLVTVKDFKARAGNTYSLFLTGDLKDKSLKTIHVLDSGNAAEGKTPLAEKAVKPEHQTKAEKSKKVEKAVKTEKSMNKTETEKTKKAR